MSRRPQPTSSISLIDFAGKKEIDRLQQTSDVVAERRRVKRGALAKSEAAASSGNASVRDPEKFFASRVDRTVASAAPRRVPGQTDALVGRGGGGGSGRGGRQAHADALRKKARDLAAALPDDERGEDGDTHDQLLRAFVAYGLDEESDALSTLEEWVARMRTCCICIESIRREDRIWSCSQCATPVHLGCIQTWATRLMGFADTQNMKDSEPWGCPNCRRTFKRLEYPSEYYCFCGKQADPKPDPWILPHSCGDHCEKDLSCGHQCKVLCHPGRCPPCPLSVLVPCHCGATKKTKRCGNPSFSCGGKCGRMHACGKHPCKKDCHAGDCGICEMRLVSTCRCGKSKKLVKCAEAADFRCEAVCGKLKPCGLHVCEEVCCDGACTPCPTEKTCACGRTVVKGSCRELEVAKVRCEHTCNKMLDCRKHRCMRRCHEGPCSGCNQVAKRSCRCGATSKEVSCSLEFLCDRKCNKERSCGNHQCNRRCCDGSCPPCTASCNRKLDCGFCRCSLVCGHSGHDSLGAALYNCPPCQKQNEVRCFCGGTSIMVPCGLPKKPPPCSLPCKVPPTCHHEARPPHRCHSGPCPPCGQECGAELACGHQCSSPCHDPVPELDLAAASWTKRPRGQEVEEALRALMPAPLTLAQVSCPPCPGLVDRPCLGRHMRAKRKCHEVQWFSCGKSCGNWLPCGNHRCQKECHSVLDERVEEDFEALLQLEDHAPAASSTAEPVGDASAADAEVPPPPVPTDDMVPWRRRKGAAGVAQAPAPSDCGECELACRRPRARGCRHACPWPCHYEPCPPCFEDVVVRCYCEQSLLTYACCEVLSWSVLPSEALSDGARENPFLRCNMPCHRKMEGCPHMCTAKCHFGPCPPCAKKDVTARCRCGKVRQQLPCSQVWIDGKQLVLDCIEDCKIKELPPAETAEPTTSASAEGLAVPAGEAERVAPEGSELRERRKDKRKKREEELEERRLQEEQEERARIWRRRWRNAAVCLWLLMMVGLLAFGIKTMRDRELERRQEEEQKARVRQGRRASQRKANAR